MSGGEAFDLAAARQRILKLRSDIDGIDAQLNLVKARADEDGSLHGDDLAWKRRAVAAKNFKLDELRQLKARVDEVERAPVRRWLRALVAIARECEDDLDIEEIELVAEVSDYLNVTTVYENANNGAAA